MKGGGVGSRPPRPPVVWGGARDVCRVVEIGEQGAHLGGVTYLYPRTRIHGTTRTRRARRGRHVVAELEKTLEARAGVLGPRPVVPVGEEEDEACVFVDLVGGWVVDWPLRRI